MGFGVARYQGVVLTELSISISALAEQVGIRLLEPAQSTNSMSAWSLCGCSQCVHQTGRVGNAVLVIILGELVTRRAKPTRGGRRLALC
jgi:hypothetical protein